MDVFHGMLTEIHLEKQGCPVINHRQVASCVVFFGAEVLKLHQPSRVQWSQWVPPRFPGEVGVQSPWVGIGENRPEGWLF